MIGFDIHAHCIDPKKISALNFLSKKIISNRSLDVWFLPVNKLQTKSFLRSFLAFQRTSQLLPELR